MAGPSDTKCSELQLTGVDYFALKPLPLLQDREYEQFLKGLSAYLRQHHKHRVVILIDECDTPIHAGYDNGYYDDEIIDFMRNFLSGGFKIMIISLRQRDVDDIRMRKRT